MTKSGPNRGKQRLKGYDYLVLGKKEIDSAKSMFTKLIELDKFASSWRILITNSSEKPYALLRKVLEITGLAAIGKVTMSTKKRVFLMH